jgi:phage terminase large subunit-like protein
LRWLHHRPLPELTRIVVAIDPAASSSEDADETGIILAAKDARGTGYVLGDYSGRYTPTQWAERAIALYRDHKADRVVGEVNNGGEMVENTLRMVDANVAFTAVRASRGKVIRAEPVSALYEQNRVWHVGSFPMLEDQMCGFTSDFDRSIAGFSPDRVDALVWAFTDLLVAPMKGEGIFELYRRDAAAAAAAKAQSEQKPKSPPQPGSMEWFEMMKNRQSAQSAE